MLRGAVLIDMAFKLTPLPIFFNLFSILSQKIIPEYHTLSSLQPQMTPYG